MKQINKGHTVNNLKTNSHGTPQTYRHQHYTVAMYSKCFCATMKTFPHSK